MKRNLWLNMQPKAAEASTRRMMANPHGLHLLLVDLAASREGESSPDDPDTCVVSRKIMDKLEKLLKIPPGWTLAERKALQKKAFRKTT